jgi:polysaccharide pyruvyl transferase WcaK-like protein
MTNIGSKRPPRLLLTGGWGYGNRGDDAILAGLLHGLRELVDFELILTSFSPRETRGQVGIEATTSIHGLITWRRPRPALRLVGTKLWQRRFARMPRALRSQAELMASADLIVFGGGGYFNDVWGEAYPARKLEIEMARASGTPFMMIGQTFGPFSAETIDQDLKGLLGDAAAVSYRDLSSARILRQAGVSPDRMSYSADLAHLVPVLERSSGQSDRIRIGMTFQNHRPYGTPSGTVPFGKLDSPEKYERALLETVGELAAIPNASFELIPSTTWDEPFMRKLEKAIRQSGVSTTFHPTGNEISDFVRTCQSLDVLISTNMHPVILASLAQVPSVALTYNFKLDDYMQRIGRSSSCFRLDDFQVEDVVNATQAAIETPRPSLDLTRAVAEATAEAKLSLTPVMSALTGK